LLQNTAIVLAVPAAAALRSSLQHTPAQADGWVMLRSVLLQRGDVAAALGALRAQQAAIGDTPALAFEEARLLLSQRQGREAEAVLARIPPGAPEHLHAARLLPQLALERFALEAAARAAEAGLAQHPGDVLLTISLAQALFRQARFDEAIIPLNAALAAEAAIARPWLETVTMTVPTASAAAAQSSSAAGAGVGSPKSVASASRSRAKRAWSAGA
jgi:cytochrome c-type biogenesis protein CcmH/NrfG